MFCSAKGDLVQRCLKDAITRSGLAPEPRPVVAAPGSFTTDRLGRGSDVVSGPDATEQSFPRRLAHSALMCATGGRHSAANNSSLANPLHASSQGPAPSFPKLAGHTSFGSV